MTRADGAGSKQRISISRRATSSGRSECSRVRLRRLRPARRARRSCSGSGGFGPRRTGRTRRLRCGGKRWPSRGTTTSCEPGSCSSSASSSGSPRVPRRRSSSSEAAVDTAARVDDDDLECRTLAAHALVHFNSGRGIDHEGMERALALESALADGGTRMPATPFLVHQLVWSGQYERAREAHDRWRSWARDREHPDQGDAAWYLALLEWRAGHWEAPPRPPPSAITLTEQFGREAMTIASWPAAVIAAHRGELDASPPAGGARSRRRRPAARRRGGLRVGARLHRALARRCGPSARAPRTGRTGLCRRWGSSSRRSMWFLPDLLDALLSAGRGRSRRGVARALGKPRPEARPALGARGGGASPGAPPRGTREISTRRSRASRRRSLQHERAQGSVPAGEDAACSRRDRAAREAAPRRTRDARAGARALRRPARAVVGREGAGRARADRRPRRHRVAS